jgi:hypothetical protein
MSDGPVKLFSLPALWSIIGFGAVVKRGVHEETGLLVAAGIATVAIVVCNRHLRNAFCKQYG